MTPAASAPEKFQFATDPSVKSVSVVNQIAGNKAPSAVPAAANRCSGFGRNVLNIMSTPPEYKEELARQGLMNSYG
ncbi:hypothetical protein D3C87_1842750 [compost metagenome]